MITFSKVSKTYTPKKGVPVEALKEVSFSLPDKGLFFILGRSGSGKSTALHLLGGLDSATGGDILVDGKSTKDFTQKDWDAYRNVCAGFVFQDYNLFDDFTVRKNIALAGGDRLGEGIRRLREGRVLKTAGFDGEYGKIALFTPEELKTSSGQLSFLSEIAVSEAQPAAEPKE